MFSYECVYVHVSQVWRAGGGGIYSGQKGNESLSGMLLASGRASEQI